MQYSNSALKENFFYTEFFLDHYRSPRNFGVLEGANGTATLRNPLCGDEIMMQVSIKEGRVSAIRFSGEGCALSIAAASLLTEYIRGREGDAVHALGRTWLEKTLAIEVGPLRIKCALLPLETLKLACAGALFC